MAYETNITYATISHGEAERLAKGDAVRQEQIRRARKVGKILNWYKEEIYGTTEI